MSGLMWLLPALGFPSDVLILENDHEQRIRDPIPEAVSTAYVGAGHEAAAFPLHSVESADGAGAAGGGGGAVAGL